MYCVQSVESFILPRSLHVCACVYVFSHTYTYACVCVFDINTDIIGRTCTLECVRVCAEHSAGLINS